jgi:hypothetical protein
MKRILKFGLLCGLLAGSAGCTSTYSVHLKNGMTMTAYTEPVQNSAGEYVFENSKEKKVRMSEEEVLYIEGDG